MLLQVAANQSGSLVYKIDPLAPAHDVLKESDLVMKIDGVLIADDGTVEVHNEEKAEFSHIVRTKHTGIDISSGTLSQIKGLPVAHIRMLLACGRARLKPCNNGLHSELIVQGWFLSACVPALSSVHATDGTGASLAAAHAIASKMTK